MLFDVVCDGDDAPRGCSPVLVTSEAAVRDELLALHGALTARRAASAAEGAATAAAAAAAAEMHSLLRALGAALRPGCTLAAWRAAAAAVAAAGLTATLRRLLRDAPLAPLGALAAARGGHWDAAEALLDGGREGSSVLHCAVAGGAADAAAAVMLGLGGSATAVLAAAAAHGGPRGDTPFTLAAAVGDADMIKARRLLRPGRAAACTPGCLYALKRLPERSQALLCSPIGTFCWFRPVAAGSLPGVRAHDRTRLRGSGA